MILTPCCLVPVSKNEEFDDDFKSLEKSLIHRTVNNRFQPSNFLPVSFLDTFLTDSKLASNSVFFDTYPILKIFTKNTFGVILSLFVYPHWDRRVIQPNRFRKHYCTAPPNCHPSCDKIYLLYCSPPPFIRNQEKPVTYIKERSGT